MSEELKFRKYWFINIDTGELIWIESQFRPWLDHTKYKYDGVSDEDS